MEKWRISTVFLGFYAIFFDFLRFFPNLPSGKGWIQREMRFSDLFKSTAHAAYRSPKSTFFFGTRAAAMGVFSASTTGAAMRK